MHTVIHDHEIMILKRRESKMWLVVFLLSLIILGQTYLLNKKSTQTILIPPTLNSEYILDHETSPLYLENFGIYFANLLLNYTPADIESHFAHILMHIHPEYKKVITHNLAGQMDFIKKNGVCQRGVIKKTEVKKSRVFIQALVQRSIGNQNISTTDVSLEIEFSIDPTTKMMQIKELKLCGA